MERLTHNDDEGKVELRIGKILEYIQPVYERLSAYEDTNLTPAEIEAMKAENERLKANQNNAELALEEMTYIIQKAAHRRCDYCILKNEPCPARGLNAECCFEYGGLEE